MSGLSLVAPAEEDELLSSWLDRTATLHGIRRRDLLEWSKCSAATVIDVDDGPGEEDLLALTHMMRSNKADVWERTHGWLGCLRGDVVCRARARVRCQRCADDLRACHGVEVYLKHWTEAWRIRCIVCGDILSQSGEEAFSHELGWHWYEPIIADADRGSARVAAAIEQRLVSEMQHGRALGPLPGNARAPLLPTEVRSIFGLDRPDSHESGALSRLSFAKRLFVLAAVGAQRPKSAEGARRLLNVWLENRRLQNQAQRRRRKRRAGSSLKINVNLRPRPPESQINVANWPPARPQSQN